jgi:hypothetical protein
MKLMERTELVALAFRRVRSFDRRSVLGGLNKNFVPFSVNLFSEDFSDFFRRKLLKELKLSPPSSHLVAVVFGPLCREGRRNMEYPVFRSRPF